MAHSELDQSTAATRKRWDSRYSEGVTPWDTQTTPPEVVDFWASKRLPPQGMALDLGCGPGTNVRYLARLGLVAIGIEIASAPLITAHERIERYDPDIRARAHFVCADVCRVPFVNLNATYILDVGCLHSLPRAVRAYYVQSVVNNLAPGGYYHLYAFDADPENTDPPSGPVGMMLDEVAQRFSPSLTVVEEIIAKPDRRPCRWYLLQRPVSS